MPTLDESGFLTREALSPIIAASPPASVEIEGRRVSVTHDRTSDALRVVASWDGGRVAFRLLIRPGIVERGRAEDHGHVLGLQVFADAGKRELIWTTFEWRIRDAIRAGESDVSFQAANSYGRRKDDIAESRDVSGFGPRSRAITQRCGLGGTPTLTLGSYSLETKRWEPEPAEILRRLIVLAVIKAHFFDRGDGITIEDAPLFALAGRDEGHNGEELRTGTDRLAAAPRMPGPVHEQVGVVTTILEHAQQEGFTPAALEQWLEARYGSEARNISTVRLLMNTGLLIEEAGNLILGPLGVRLLETGDRSHFFRALRETYTGFDETLAFFANHPGARVGALRKHLNAAIPCNWETDTQARIRAYWLVSCGLLQLDKGQMFVTDAGRNVLAQLPVPTAPLDEKPSVDEADDDPATTTREVRLDPSKIDVADLVLPPGLIERCCAAINAGKNLLLVGPPGTGKSTIAERLAEYAATTGVCEEPLTSTASADWTTYDTIGGWTQRADQTLAFREGVVTRALRERRWLVLDEVNRADIDKCFGELFTVLAGGSVTTAYTRHEKGEEVPVEIGRDAVPYTYGPWFRLLATMNLRDKASLFRLSYAFMRRFAVIVVPALDDSALATLAARESQRLGLGAAVRDLAVSALSQKEGLGKDAPLGPSLLLDVLRYACVRGSGAERAIAEAVGMVVLPQLEGIGDAAARRADAVLGQLFGADPVALREVREQLRSNFSHLTFDV